MALQDVRNVIQTKSLADLVIRMQKPSESHASKKERYQEALNDLDKTTE